MVSPFQNGQFLGYIIHSFHCVLNVSVASAKCNQGLHQNVTLELIKMLGLTIFRERLANLIVTKSHNVPLKGFAVTSNFDNHKSDCWIFLRASPSDASIRMVRRAISQSKAECAIGETMKNHAHNRCQNSARILIKLN